MKGSHDRINLAKLKAKAKEFKKSIPLGMAIPVSDRLIAAIPDKDIKTFLEILNSLGLQQQNNGYWERI